jgi:hypothetical protein
MTSKVTVEAQSHWCQVRLMPRVGDDDLWKTLSDETKKFAQFDIPPGERREYVVHAGQSVLVREIVLGAAKNDTNYYDEFRASAQIAPAGRYLLRGINSFDKPYEAELVEWSEGGRLRVRHRSGCLDWLEGRDIPFVVERLASGIETEGHDPEEGHGEKHERPARDSGDAQP